MSSSSEAKTVDISLRMEEGPDGYNLPTALDLTKELIEAQEIGGLLALIEEFGPEAGTLTTDLYMDRMVQMYEEGPITNHLKKDQIDAAIIEAEVRIAVESGPVGKAMFWRAEAHDALVAREKVDSTRQPDQWSA